MKLLKFTHSNHTTQIEVVAEKICGFFFSPAHQATFVVSDGQTVFPVKETMEQVRAALLNIHTVPSAMNVVDIKTKQPVTVAQPVPKEDNSNEQRNPTT